MSIHWAHPQPQRYPKPRDCKSAATDWAHYVGSSGGLITIVVMSLLKRFTSLMSVSVPRRVRPVSLFWSSLRLIKWLCKLWLSILHLTLTAFSPQSRPCHSAQNCLCCFNADTPKITESPGKEAGIQSQEYTLECKAYGHPNPTFEFFKVSCVQRVTSI